MPNDNINITPEMLKNISNILSSSNASNFNDSINKDSKENDELNIDIESILKMKSIVEKLNQKNDPRTNLLYSLKPYLNKSRQQKLDKYANILKISDVATLFKEQKKGDEN